MHIFVSSFNLFICIGMDVKSLSFAILFCNKKKKKKNEKKILS